jgi:hypothetical protein
VRAVGGGTVIDCPRSVRTSPPCTPSRFLPAAFDVASMAMEWRDVPAWLGVLAAFISVFFGYLSWKASRKSKDDADRAERALRASEEQAIASKQLVAEAARSAAAAEQQAAIADATKAASERVRWDISHSTGAQWKLRNLSPTTAYGVVMMSSDLEGQYGFEKVDGHGEVTFWALGATGGEAMTVAWHLTPDQSDPVGSWKGVFPRP